MQYHIDQVGSTLLLGEAHSIGPILLFFATILLIIKVMIIWFLNFTVCCVYC